jgi:WD40 repeat protein
MKSLKNTITMITLCITVASIAQTRYYASNRLQNAVNIYEEDGTYIEEFIEMDSGGLSSPQDIILHPEGFLLVTGTDNTRIKKYDLETGAFLGDWSDAAFELGRPSKMTIGPDDLLYVTQWGQTAPTAKIVRFDLEGNYLGPFTPIAPTGLGHVWDDQGNFYLAIFGPNGNDGEVRKYNTDGNFIEVFIDGTILQNPSYIWWDTNGDMLVQDFTAGKVLRYDASGNYIEDFITGLITPEGYTILPNGNIIIAERSANQISEWDSDGNLIGRWDNGGALIGVNFIEAIDASSLSTPVNQKEKTILVTPSVGNNFKVNKGSNLFEKIEIYSVAGILIASFLLKDSDIWNAQSVSEGLYFIQATDSEGTTHTQKIVVAHM